MSPGARLQTVLCCRSLCTVECTVYFSVMSERVFLDFLNNRNLSNLSHFSFSVVGLGWSQAQEKSLRLESFCFICPYRVWGAASRRPEERTFTSVLFYIYLVGASISDRRASESDKAHCSSSCCISSYVSCQCQQGCCDGELLSRRRRSRAPGRAPDGSHVSIESSYVPFISYCFFLRMIRIL